MSKVGWKALVAVVGVALAAVGGTAINGDVGDLSTGDWLAIVATVLGSGALTALVTNIPGVFGGAVKAVVAALAAFVGALIVYYTPDSVISQGELLTALAAGIAILAGTYEQDDTKPPGA